MTAQQYIDQAVAAGIPRSAIDYFLSGNPHDEHRILSALGPDYIHPAASVAPAPIAPISTSITYAPVSPYATPTPQAVSGGVSALLPAATDAMLIAHTADNVTHPQLTIVDRSPGGSGGFAPPLTTTQILPAAGAIPPWLLIAALAIVAFVLLRK